MALMATARGRCLIADKVFPERFTHVDQLQRLNAELTGSHASTFAGGNARLMGNPVVGSDLRSTAALVLAALSARGETIVRGMRHLDRGYEHLDRKLQSLGAKITRSSLELVTGRRHLAQKPVLAAST
jgi:UDP-N-acetylglucosamine 1-carboxyvinyltransferase